MKITEEELNQLSKLPYYTERMERIEMMKGFSNDNNGLSSLEPNNFAKYIDWLENRLFESNNEIKRLRSSIGVINDFAAKADINVELRGTVDFTNQEISFDKIISKSKLK